MKLRWLITLLWCAQLFGQGTVQFGPSKQFGPSVSFSGTATTGILQVGSGVVGSACTGPGATCTVTKAGVTGGNSLIASFGYCEGNCVGTAADPGVTSVCDNGTTCGAGHTFALCGGTASGTTTYNVLTYILTNVTGGSETITFTAAAGTPQFIVGQVSEWSGIQTASPCDQKGTANNTGSPGTSAAVTATGSTTQTNELIYAVTIADNTITKDAAYTIVTGSATNRLDEFEIGTTLSTYTASPTQASGIYTSSISTFKHQ